MARRSGGQATLEQEGIMSPTYALIFVVVIACMAMLYYLSVRRRR